MTQMSIVQPKYKLEFLDVGKLFVQLCQERECPESYRIVQWTHMYYHLCIPVT